jgi:hypothetical protein
MAPRRSRRNERNFHARIFRGARFTRILTAINTHPHVNARREPSHSRRRLPHRHLALAAVAALDAAMHQVLCQVRKLQQNELAGFSCDRYSALTTGAGVPDA